ncbi:hypothetical protein J6590_057104 [Homalodisca vitripennis]|nr:hypothetical protein J6590_057104 [Homalodisca vitripennis]
MSKTRDSRSPPPPNSLPHRPPPPPPALTSFLVLSVKGDSTDRLKAEHSIRTSYAVPYPGPQETLWQGAVRGKTNKCSSTLSELPPPPPSPNHPPRAISHPPPETPSRSPLSPAEIPSLDFWKHSQGRPSYE